MIEALGYGGREGELLPGDEVAGIGPWRRLLEAAFEAEEGLPLAHRRPDGRFLECGQGERPHRSRRKGGDGQHTLFEDSVL